LAGSVAYVAVPLLIVAVVARPSRAAVKDMAWPSAPARRLAATAFWAVLLLPALIAPFAGLRLVSLWSMSAFALLPVMLLSSPLRRRRFRARGCIPVRHGGDRAGDRVCHPQRGPGAGRRPRLAARPADRAAVAPDDRPAVANFQRLRRTHRWRQLLHAQPSACGARARRHPFRRDRGAHRPRRHRIALSRAIIR